MDRAFRDDVNALIGKPLLAALDPHGKPPTDALRKCAAVAALRGWALRIEFDQSASIRMQDARHVTLTGALIDTVSTATDKRGIWTVTAVHYG